MVGNAYHISLRFYAYIDLFPFFCYLYCVGSGGKPALP